MLSGAKTRNAERWEDDTAVCPKCGQKPNSLVYDPIGPACARHSRKVRCVVILDKDAQWREGDPCGACGSTNTYGYAGNAGCRDCNAHDQDGG